MSKLYTMKEACELCDMSYDTLKYYCNEGLVPGVIRKSNNYRYFDEPTIEWIKSLNCLKNCRMSIAEMKEYVELSKEGVSSIPVRQDILAQKRVELEAKMAELQAALDYLDWKEQFYRDVLAGKKPYKSSLREIVSRDEVA